MDHAQHIRLPLVRTAIVTMVCLALMIFTIFVASYKKHLLQREQVQVNNHAKIISASLWNYERQTPTDYLTLAIETQGYQQVTVSDEFGRLFLQLSGRELSRQERLLQALHLTHTHEIEAPIAFEDKTIGTIQVIWYCQAIYTYLYILFCLALLLCAVSLYLKLLEAKQSLECRVQLRTAELELEVQERKKAEKELKFQAQRLSMHVRHTPLGVVEWSPDFRIVEWNRAAEKIFGYSRGEVLGQRPYGLIIPEEEKASIKETWQQLLAQKGGTRSINSNLTKDGQIRTCDWYNTPLTDPDGEIIGVASLVLDISEQLLAQEKNRQLQEQLLHAQKMEAVGNMAGGIAHDFNNLLQSISGYTQLLLLDCHREGLDCTRLEGIEKASRRAADLVKQMLTFSRKITSNLMPVNLNQEIRQIRSMLDRTIPKMVAIEMALESELHTIEADPVQIEQIVLNLAINANHAMKEGGILTIETANLYLDKAFCNSHLGATEGMNVLLRVTDTGEGMSPETVARIFEPFFTTKETGKGTGLGLASVYGIVHNHKAYIECISKVGHGTTFRVYFPAMKGSPPLPVKDFVERDIPGGHETVLLVDDEATIREIGREILSTYGYTVLTAASGEDGLSLYRQEGGGIDIIIMDLNMPGMGGFKCMQALKEEDPDCRILVASGYTPAEYLQQATALGAEGFLSKPFQMTALLRKIRETLDMTPHPEKRP